MIFMQLNFLLKKIFICLISIFLIISLTFFLMHYVPGHPFMEDQAISAEIFESLQRYYGLDQPIIQQYFNYINSIIHLDFGYSLKYQGRTVIQIISEGFPISFILGLEAFILALVGGICFGAMAAIYQGKWLLRAGILCLSLPAFLLATFLQYFFAIQWDLFPIARWGSFAHTILPATSLALFPLAYIMRLTYTNILIVLRQEYIATVRSKGLNETEIIYKHVLRNALIPVIAYTGPLMAIIFTGSFVIEKIFGIPGLGQWLVVSINNRDYPVIMGITIFYSSLLMVCNFMVDYLSYILIAETT